jgi:hypothetical protein
MNVNLTFTKPSDLRFSKIYVDDVLFHVANTYSTYHLTKIFLILNIGGTLVELLILPLINRLWKLIM